MLQGYRIIRDAAERISRAAEGTVSSLRDGRVEQEPAFTDRMLGRIEQAMEGHSHNGVSWRAKTLTDRGPKAQESRFGADFFGVLEIKLPDYSVSKGFLAQGKLIEPNDPMPTREFERMRDQCAQMLRLSQAAFLFLYSNSGITTVPAIAVVSSSRTNPHNLYSRSIARFYEEHFASFIGDHRISSTEIAALEVIASTYEARSGIQLSAIIEDKEEEPLPRPSETNHTNRAKQLNTPTDEVSLRIDRFLNELASASWWDREQALKQLAHPDFSAAVPRICSLLSSERDWQVASQAAKTLASIGDPRGVAALLGALLHIHPEVRRQAALALGNLGANDAATALIEMLRYEMDPTAKYGGIVSLGRLKSSQALVELEILLNSSEKTSYGESIGSAASEALRLIREGFSK